METTVLHRFGSGDNDVRVLWMGELAAIPSQGQGIMYGGKLYRVSDVVFSLPMEASAPYVKPHVSITVRA